MANGGSNDRKLFYVIRDSFARPFLGKDHPDSSSSSLPSFFCTTSIDEEKSSENEFPVSMFPKTHFDYKKIVLDIILCHSFAYYFTHVDPFLCLAIWTMFKKGHQKSGQKMVTWVCVKFCMWSLILLKIWHPLATCQNSMSWFTMTCSAIQASIHFNQD